MLVWFIAYLDLGCSVQLLDLWLVWLQGTARRTNVCWNGQTPIIACRQAIFSNRNTRRNSCPDP